MKVALQRGHGVLHAGLDRSQELRQGPKAPQKRGVTQRVQLECHYGIRAPRTIYGMVFGTYFHSGILIGPSGYKRDCRGGIWRLYRDFTGMLQGLYGGSMGDYGGYIGVV